LSNRLTEHLASLFSYKLLEEPSVARLYVSTLKNIMHSHLRVHPNPLPLVCHPATYATAAAAGHKHSALSLTKDNVARSQ